MTPFASTLHRSPSAGSAVEPRRAALVLAGCGSRDGSEITEAVALMVALTQENFQLTFFAPDRPQHHTVNHLTNKEEGPARNMLQEAARIARGQVKPLVELRAAEFDVLVFAGGFGVAKNLCTFAFEGAKASLAPDARATLLAFLNAKKPVAALCIAPVLLALAAKELGWQGAKVTLGDGSATDAVSAVESWGLTHVACRSGEACIDAEHRLVSAPAYMISTANPADIHSCAKALVAGLKSLLV